MWLLKKAGCWNREVWGRHFLLLFAAGASSALSGSLGGDGGGGVR